MESAQHLRHGHAVVIGASLAGLLAARALSERFERLTLVERDTRDVLLELLRLSWRRRRREAPAATCAST
jgi:2-polyprenyl-6-methoxyphenol hydroxylase-like FAD-dependent oxidoreductase